jgi:chromosome segregation ATPase
MLGSIVGWLLRGGCSAHIKRVEKNWRGRYLALEKEKESYVNQVNKLRLVDDETDTLTEQLAKCQKVERLNSHLRSHLKDIEIGAQVIQSELRTKTQGLAKCQNVLKASKKILYAKDETLHELTRKLKIATRQLNEYKVQFTQYDSQNNERVKELKAGIGEAKNLSEHYKLERDEKDQQTIAVNKQLASTQLKLDDLANEFAKTGSDLVNIKASFAEKDESIEMLTATVKTRDEMVEYYEKQLEKQGAENKQLSGKLEGLANEFARVASAMMQAKSAQKTEYERHQEEVQGLTLALESVEGKLVQVDKALEKKEQEQVLQKKRMAKQDNAQSKSKLHRLERKLKHMKKKLKAVSSDRNIQREEEKSKSQGQNIDSAMSNVSLSGISEAIEKIRGIGAGHGARLHKLGISSNHDLLQSVLSDQDAQVLAKKVSCKPTDILLWKKMADFMRIEGVNAEFAQLLMLSKLNSVQNVAAGNAMQLLDKMKVARKKERRIHHLPELEEINQWIHYAKMLNTEHGK